MWGVEPIEHMLEVTHGAARGQFMERLRNGSAVVGVIGMGYVGLPLALEFAHRFKVIGFDVDASRVAGINAGKSHVGDVESAALGSMIESGAMSASDDFALLKDCDAVIVCVPTPLEKSLEPDISYVLSAAAQVAAHLRFGQLIVLESTTYPGTTDEALWPLFEGAGLALDRDFLLAFSPERVDPGNREFKIPNIPKIVGGCSIDSTLAACALYETIVHNVYRVSSARVAETAKLWENTFRAVNIALANEMALLCFQLGIESSEVVDAAKTKPFGFMPFYPGPGVGGHCIPLDPHYLSWKAKQHGFHPRFIQIAQEINGDMPDHIVALVADALNNESQALRGARVLVIGVAYKANVNDVRQSPAIEIIELLQRKGCIVRYHDPYVEHLHVDMDELAMAHLPTSSNGMLHAPGRRDSVLSSVALTPQAVRESDCAVIVTAHDCVDYEMVGFNAPLVVDTRNVLPRACHARVVRL